MLRPLGVKSRWINWPVDAAGLFFAALGIFKLATLFDYRVPVEVHSRDIKTPIVAAGEPFQYDNHFTRHKFCTTHVDRWFIGSDKGIRTIAPVNSGMPTEGLDELQTSPTSIIVPNDMPPGESKSCFQASWVCEAVEIGGRRFGPQVLWPIKGDPTCIPFTVSEPPPPLSMWLYPIPPHTPQTSVALEGEP